MIKKSSSVPLLEPIDAVVFDCDGTLSQIEGIDELAKKGVGDEVKRMTALAMAKTGLSPELYQQRLSLVQPSYSQLVALATEYFAATSEDAFQVITLLRRLNKAVFIISAGLNPSVTLFGQQLTVPAEHIYAVDVIFNEKKHYLSFDEHSPLVHKNGKREVINQIKQRYPRLVFIGDGINDLEASDLAVRFIGYGGAYYRENIAEQCEFYLRHASLASLLPLALTELEYQKLSASEQKLMIKGIQLLELGDNFYLSKVLEKLNQRDTEYEQGHVWKS